MTAVPVSLGMPALPPARLAERRKTRQLDVGGVLVGGGAPISVQSMTTTVTADVNATLQQIAALTGHRLPDRPRRRARPGRRRGAAAGGQAVADPGHRRHPLPEQVHLRGDRRRLRRRARQPGQHPRVRRQGRRGRRAAKASGTPIRIGVNAGSLDKRIMAKYGKATPEALVESALWECSLFEEHDFRDIKISVKHNDPVVMVQAYRLLSQQCDYPLHLGVTEAGPPSRARSSRRSPSGAAGRGHRRHDPRLAVAPPVEEVKVGPGDPRVAEPQAARPRDRLLPVLRAAPRSTSTPSPSR
jgi:(E)-4-hydroxy-3-methylbut-2-enyl-diphosphate synthase